MKVDINSDSCCGSITTGTLTITPSPITIKPKDLYTAPGEKVLLEPDILDDGLTSLGLHGSDYWDVWADYVVKDARSIVVFSGPTNMPKDINLPAGEYEVSIVYDTYLIRCYDEYKTEKELLLGVYDLTLLPGKLVITDEPYVNPIAASRNGDYLDIDTENWNLDAGPYAGYNFDTSALPADFSMDDLNFIVTYNGEMGLSLWGVGPTRPQPAPGTAGPFLSIHFNENAVLNIRIGFMNEDFAETLKTFQLFRNSVYF